MKHLYFSIRLLTQQPLKALLIAAGMLAAHNSATAQCTGTVMYPGETFFPSANAGFETIDGCNWGGDYAVVSVQEGNTYVFSTCAESGSNADYDTQLTLRTTNGDLLEYNDDFCGLQSQISWTATFSGDAHIHLHEYNCVTNETCTEIRVSRDSWCTASAQFPSSTITPAPNNGFESISGCSYAGEYAVIAVTAGDTYTFSTCGEDGGEADYDTQLTLRNTDGSAIAYNDDFCGLRSKLSWEATFTGTVHLHLHEYYCESNSTCTTIRVQRETSPGADFLVPFSGGSSITTCGGIIADHADLEGNYDNGANGFTVINPTSMDFNIQLTFQSFSLECCCDYVTVFDGDGTLGAQLFEGNCNDLPPVLTASNGPLTIRFTSDGSVTSAGFSALIGCVPNTTSVNEITPELSFNVFPNPSSGIFQIDFSEMKLSGDASVSIIDYTGKIVWQQPILQSIEHADLSDAAKGVYFLQVWNNGQSSVKRVIIN